MNMPSFAWFRLRTPEHGCRFGESGCPLIVGKPQTRVTVQFVKTSASVCTDRRKCPSSLSLPSIESLPGRVKMYTDILGRLRGPRRSEPDIFAVLISSLVRPPDVFLRRHRNFGLQIFSS